MLLWCTTSWRARPCGVPIVMCQWTIAFWLWRVGFTASVPETHAGRATDVHHRAFAALRAHTTHSFDAPQSARRASVGRIRSCAWWTRLVDDEIHRTDGMAPMLCGLTRLGESFSNPFQTIPVPLRARKPWRLAKFPHCSPSWCADGRVELAWLRANILVKTKCWRVCIDRTWPMISGYCLVRVQFTFSMFGEFGPKQREAAIRRLLYAQRFRRGSRARRLCARRPCGACRCCR